MMEGGVEGLYGWRGNVALRWFMGGNVLVNCLQLLGLAEPGATVDEEDRPRAS